MYNDTMTGTYLDLPLLEFRDQKSFETWLEKHHSSVPAFWLKFYKKASGIPTVTYIEAVETSLCYGWIDSQMKSLDDDSYIQKFTPRKPRSPWSDINKARVAKLIKDGRIREAGLAAIEVAKQNGEWENAYNSPAQSTPTPEFQKALDANKKAKEFFDSISKTQQFYFTYWIRAAKREETKEKRIKEAISMLEQGKKRM